VFAHTLQRLHDEAAVSQVLLIGGGIAKPVGEISDTMQLLETGLLDKYGVRKIGVAGHPEGTPDIPDEAISQALRWKNDFARRTGAEMYLVTQFCFEAAPIIKWDKLIQAEGNVLPIRSFRTGNDQDAARPCQGVRRGSVVRVRPAGDERRRLPPSRRPTAVAARRLRRAPLHAAGCAYPLGGLKTADWSYAVADGRFRLNPNGHGFGGAPT
jgi:methylenetetrahydrofolate reductase (NADPH)